MEGAHAGFSSVQGMATRNRWSIPCSGTQQFIAVLVHKAFHVLETWLGWVCFMAFSWVKKNMMNPTPKRKMNSFCLRWSKVSCILYTAVKREMNPMIYISQIRFSRVKRASRNNFTHCKSIWQTWWLTFCHLQTTLKYSMTSVCQDVDYKWLGKAGQGICFMPSHLLHWSLESYKR